MQADLCAILEESIWDLLQDKKNGTMDEVLRIVMEALLIKQNRKDFYGMEKETGGINLREINETDTGNQGYLKD